jgi:hypothetical protein
MKFTTTKKATPTEQADSLLAEVERITAAIGQAESELTTAKAAEAKARESLGVAEADVALGSGSDTTAARADLRSKHDGVEIIEIRIGSLRQRSNLRIADLKALEPTFENAGGEVLQRYEQAWDIRFRAKTAEQKVMHQERWAIAEATHSQVPMALLQSNVPDPLQPTVNLVGLHDGWRGCPSAERLFAEITGAMAPFDRAADVLKKVRATVGQ